MNAFAHCFELEIPEISSRKCDLKVRVSVCFSVASTVKGSLLKLREQIAGIQKLG